MRTERKQQEKAQKRRHKKNSGIKRLPAVLAVIYAVVLAVFVVTVFMVGVLPFKFFIAFLAVFAVISILLLRALLKKGRTVRQADGTRAPKKKTVSSVIAVIMIIVMLFGIRTMGNTLGFFSSISGDSQVRNFYVVVRDDSSYEKLSDISGLAVGVIAVEDDTYEKAKDMLKEEADVTFEEEGNFNDAANALTGGEREAIFLNSAYYDMALEEAEGFTKETTRILAVIDVEVKAEENEKSVDVTEDAFNVYISGIDTTGSIGNISRTDVNMIMTVNPKTRTILLTSIPRDYYVNLASKNSMDKLTHSGLYGIEETTATVEGLLGIDINYYVKVNFTTVVKLVDTLGGITVDSEYSFTGKGIDDTKYSFVAGENRLTGDEALAFARERHSFASGDNQRVKNQQAVISGIIKKCSSSVSILSNYNGILNSVEDNMQTNMTPGEIKSLVKMQLNDMSGWDIQRCSLTGSGRMTPVYSIPYASVYVMVPDDSSVAEAKDKINRVLAGN